MNEIGLRMNDIEAFSGAPVAACSFEKFAIASTSLIRDQVMKLLRLCRGPSKNNILPTTLLLCGTKFDYLLLANGWL